MGQVETPGRPCNPANTLGLLVRERRGSQVRGAEGGSSSKKPLGMVALNCMRWELVLLQERGWAPHGCILLYPQLSQYQIWLSDLLPPLFPPGSPHPLSDASPALP